MLERRQDHCIDDDRGLRIGQPPLKAIADLDAYLALVFGNQQQRTVVLALLADPPGAAQLVAVIFDRQALQIGDRDHHQLLTAGLLMGLEHTADLRLPVGIKQAGLIDHTTVEGRKSDRLSDTYRSP